jgi:inhibitor of cysteine peptidase
MKKIILLPGIILAGMFFIWSAAKAETLPANLAAGNFQVLLEIKDTKQLWFIDTKAKYRILLGQPAAKDSSAKLETLAKERKINAKDIKRYSFNLGKLTGDDSDKDGLINTLEELLGTNAKKSDSDGDGFKDKVELTSGFNPAGSGKSPVYQAKISNNPLINKLAAETKIKKFNNVNELRNFLNVSRYNINGGYGSLNLFAPLALNSSTETSGLSSSDSFGAEFGTSAKSADSYSQSNVQVAGVDEGDLVKTDGKFIYALSGNNINIIKSTPANEAGVVNTIKLDSSPNGLYIDNEKLVVYGNDSNISKLPVYKKFRRHSGYSYLKVYDIKDRSNPKLLRDLKFEGQYSNSRLINGYLYYVTTMHNYAIMYDFVLPKIIENGQVISSEKNTGRFRFPNIYYFDMPYSVYNFVTVSAINVRDNNKPLSTEVYVMPNNQNMYVSEKNIYLTYTKYVSEFDIILPVLKGLVYDKLDQTDRDYISKIEQVDNSIISESEKQTKTYLVLAGYMESLTDEEQVDLQKKWKAEIKKKYDDLGKELEKTVIQKIAINGEKLSYKGSGQVAGQVLNQFSMDEQGDFFRIATTKNQTWSSMMDNSDTSSYNNLYILDNDLKVAGALEKMAETERIYAVRFMQNRAYMVTYRNTDPLFVIDLSDNKNPKVLGELKIPGYSAYLHPFDDTTLIGVGKQTEASNSGAVLEKGLKISLYDVADVKDPKEIALYIMGGRGSNSEVLGDHKAFLFSRDKNLLALPVYLTKETTDNSWGEFDFSGAAIFEIDKTNIMLKGKISHTDDRLDTELDRYMNNGVPVRRILYINDDLYTLSAEMMKINSMSNLNEIKKITF